MPIRSVPEDGDVVLHRQERDGSPIYLLHTAPGPDQFVLRSRDEAVARGLAYAKRERVRAWLIEEGQEFVLLEDCRIVASV